MLNGSPNLTSRSLPLNTLFILAQKLQQYQLDQDQFSGCLNIENLYQKLVNSSENNKRPFAHITLDLETEKFEIVQIIQKGIKVLILVTPPFTFLISFECTNKSIAA